MGEGSAGEIDVRAVVSRFIDELAGRIRVRLVILHGSTAVGEGGSWSDIDLIVISDDFEGPIADRIGLMLECRPPLSRIEPLGYTADEFLSMLKGTNPLALNAMEEGRFLFDDGLSKRLRREFARVIEDKKLTRRGNAWMPRR